MSAPCDSTVAIAYYRTPAFLQAAVDSALADPAVARVIVVDDGSPEDSAAAPLLRPDPRVLLHTQPNGGVAACRNTGLTLTETPFVLFLDGDDLLVPGAVTRLRAFHDDPVAPGAAVGCCEKLETDRTGPVARTERFPEPGYPQVLRASPIWHPAQVLFRTAAIRTVGGWRATLNACEDLDLYFRVFALSGIRSTEEIVSRWRIHGANMSQNFDKMFDGVRLVYRRHRAQISGDARLRAIARAGLADHLDHFGRGMLLACVGELRRGRLTKRGLGGACRAILRRPGLVGWFFAKIVFAKRARATAG